MTKDDQNREKLARQHLVDALKDIEIQFEADSNITMSTLARRLDSASPPIDILDYFGHGSFENGHAVLAMGEDNDRGVDLVSPTRLHLLKNLPPLIVLYACHSAQIDINDSLEAFAYKLINEGVQAVIAMQLKIRMQVVSEHVVRAFYNALANGHSLPKALAEVRRKLLIEEKDAVSWFVPTLYMREFNPQPYLLLQPASRPPSNPFANFSATTDKKLFVGREEQVQQLREWLQSKGHRAIIGLPGSGKTSILNFLETEVREKGSPEVVKLSPKRLWTFLQAQKDLKQELKGDSRAELKQKLKKTKNLILLLDNINNLEECKEGEDICEWLRTLAEEGHAYTVRLVVTSPKPLKEIEGEGFRLLSQTIRGEIELGPFNETEARAFILSRLKEVKNPFEVKDFDNILRDPLIPRDLEMACMDRYEELCNSKEKRAKILFRTFS